MKWTETRYADLDCIQLQNDSLSLWMTRSVGPRMIGMSLAGGDNLLAVQPQATAQTPSGKVYRFKGGHRLWHAPEHPERTYVPDDDPVTVTAVSANTLAFKQPIESLTGIGKQIAVTLPDQTATVILDHTLTNDGESEVTLAPWAITQLRAGGFGILPMSQAETGLLPNRRLSLWPYTQITSPHLQWGDRFVFVHATMRDHKLKIGWANPDGWLGYWIEDTLIVKQAAYQAGADYVDFGSSSECYCDPLFLELETLGPTTRLAPGEAVKHRETWRLFSQTALEADEMAVQTAIAQLGI